MSGVGIKVTLDSLNKLGSILSYYIFWNSLCRIDISSSLNIGKDSPEKLYRSGHSFVGNCLITKSLVSIGFRFVVSSYDTFASYVFQVICPFQVICHWWHGCFLNVGYFVLIETGHFVGLLQ